MTSGEKLGGAKKRAWRAGPNPGTNPIAQLTERGGCQSWLSSCQLQTEKSCENSLRREEMKRRATVEREVKRQKT